MLKLWHIITTVHVSFKLPSVALVYISVITGSIRVVKHYFFIYSNAIIDPPLYFMIFEHCFKFLSAFLLLLDCFVNNALCWSLLVCEGIFLLNKWKASHSANVINNARLDFLLMQIVLFILQDNKPAHSRAADVLQCSVY